MIRPLHSFVLRAVPALLLAMAVPSLLHAQGQVILQPQIGVQTMWFNGDYPVSQDINPGVDRDLPLGGGVLGSSNGVHIGLEVIPSEGSMIRFPVVVEAYFLNGKTTYPLTRLGERPVKRLTFTHRAQIFSAGTGITLAFTKSPTIYFSAEAKVNYVAPTSLTTRLYVLDNDSTEYEREVTPDPSSHTRIGAYLKVGAQTQFFEPFMLDFSIGYGGFNLGGRNTDPATGRNLMVVDPNSASETLLGYLGIGFGVVWKL